MFKAIRSVVETIRPGACYWCIPLKISHPLALMNSIIIKTQVTSVFGKKLKFKDSFPLNNLFSGSMTNIKLEYENYGLKWDHFLTAHLTLIYSLTSHTYCGIFLFL